MFRAVLTTSSLPSGIKTAKHIGYYASLEHRAQTPGVMQSAKASQGMGPD